MDGIKKVTTRNLWRAIIWTILLAAGIPMIIFGAVMGFGTQKGTVLGAIMVWVFIAGIFFREALYARSEELSSALSLSAMAVS